MCIRIGFGSFTIRRTEITGCENGIDAGGTVANPAVIQDNYIHNLDVVGPSWIFPGGGSGHVDGIQMGQGSCCVRAIHNHISPQDSGAPASTAGIIAYAAVAQHDI